MKRSEMLEKIAIAYCIDNRAFVNGPRKIDMYFAELALTTVEKAGMLPPKAQIPIQVNGSETYITDYCWEKE